MKRLALSLGLVVLALIWFGPLLGSWRESFAAHMLAHMGVIAIAAPLIAIGLPSRWQFGPTMPAALPVLASVMELFAVWTWHAPVMRAAAEASLLATVAEQATFLGVGVLLWSSSLAASGERRHAAAGAGALLLTSIHMTLLGALLALSPRSLYGIGEVTCFGTVLDSGQDQQLGGTIMLFVGAVVYLVGGLSLVSRLLAAPPTAATHSHDEGNSAAL
ncbi:cytochrome c oxidase assembly protein [Arvimicrobium flavum]|uniref:cytochrome c oxidase assembly protein n=1 Tax=Arvimicrobium flavum TaxID=3393320 RepID=UPI00237B99C4|nr:cytochrome c oxidase assembly protein [Mesorhizobium shangrilense]